MKKIFTNITKAMSWSVASFVRLVPLLVVGVLTFSSTKAQVISSNTTSLITSNMATISFSFNPNCVNGGNYTVEWSTDGFSTTSSSSFSVGNGAVTRTFVLPSLLPNTLYYWRVIGKSGLGCSTKSVTSATQTFTTLPSPTVTMPTISSISATMTDNSATIFYSLSANNGTANSVVKYGLTNGSLPNQVTGFDATGSSVTSDKAEITGLQPSTTYYYQIEATNSAGTSTSTTGSFTTAPPFTAQTIAEYTFDNTYNNINGTAPFGTNNGVSFVNDRHGNANSAINIVNTGTSATITGLPYGGTARTVSLWVKVNNFSVTPYNMLYSYGVAGAGQVNGASFSATDVWHFGYNNNHQAALSNALNTWHHFVFTYDGTNSKIYKNGVLVSTLAKNWNTVNNNNLFKLGVGVGGELTFDGAIDDLKIFNYALTQNDITSLYANNVITSVEDNMEMKSNAVYPNPAKDILHVSGTAEIFDLVGNKVASGTNEINIEHLISGIYVVKTNGKSQKIVKE